MFGFGKKKQEKAGEEMTPTGRSTQRIEESIHIIEETVKSDIRSFFSNDRNMETLVAKMRNKELAVSLGMMAMPPSDENMAKAKMASEKITELYGT